MSFDWMNNHHSVSRNNPDFILVVIGSERTNKQTFVMIYITCKLHAFFRLWRGTSYYTLYFFKSVSLITTTSTYFVIPFYLWKLANFPTWKQRSNLVLVTGLKALAIACNNAQQPRFCHVFECDKIYKVYNELK